jgi:hypothetical protein
VANTDTYTKEKTIPVSSSKSGPVIAKREVKKVSVLTYNISLLSNFDMVNILQSKCVLFLGFTSSSSECCTIFTAFFQVHCFF